MYPARFTASFWLVMKTIITLDLRAFAMVLPTFKIIAVQVFSFFTIIKIGALYFGQPGSLLTLNG
jgi:hypothetical protein